MIFITFGTIPYPFDRLVDWIKIMLEDDVITEKIFIQHGSSDISAIEKHYLVNASPIINLSEMNQIIDRASLIISHAGQGTTRKLAATNKSFAIVPRLSKYGEHVDDHQLQFAQSVSREFGVCYCNTIEDFKELILNPPQPIHDNLFHGPKLAQHLLKTFPSNQLSSVSQ
jgi:UDP-N-acetylglucosamine transferase subunit ALG13